MMRSMRRPCRRGPEAIFSCLLIDWSTVLPGPSAMQQPAAKRFLLERVHTGSDENEINRDVEEQRQQQDQVGENPTQELLSRVEPQSESTEHALDDLGRMLPRAFP